MAVRSWPRKKLLLLQTMTKQAMTSREQVHAQFVTQTFNDSITNHYGRQYCTCSNHSCRPGKNISPLFQFIHQSVALLGNWTRHPTTALNLRHFINLSLIKSCTVSSGARVQTHRPEVGISETLSYIYSSQLRSRSLRTAHDVSR